MKKILLISILLTTIVFSAEKKLGAWYYVSRTESPYVAASGDMSIETLPAQTKVRLIKDESVAETLILIPVRIIKLMFTIKPHGNWLVEDDNGNRGYMWDSDLELVKK